MALRSTVVVRAGVVTGLALTGAAGVLLAGPLNPPVGPVAASFKTLGEVEPRIAVNATNTPGTATAVYRITQPGSYYLAENLVGVSGKHGVEIACAGVTLDLRGFEAAGVAGSQSGVYASLLNATGIVVRNGTVRAWGSIGVNVAATKGSRVEQISAIGNSVFGIAAGQSARVEHCTASANVQGGIVGSTSFTTVQDCTAAENGVAGISIQRGSVIGCHSLQNTGAGINVLFDGLISGCTVDANTGTGIFAQTGCRVHGCVVTASGNHGIEVSANGEVVENSCSGNGSAVANGAGVHTLSTGNRVDSNSVNSNDYGILCDSANTLVVRNSARANTAGNYSFPAGAEYGQVITNPGSAFVASNPWANFAY